MKKCIYSIVVFLIVSSCTPDPHLGEFDSEKWRKDHKACKNYRSDLINELMKEKHHLIGVSESTVKNILGNPNFTDIRSRKQKYLIYYVDPSEGCPNYITNKKRRLVLRVSAISTIQSIQLEK